MWSKREGYPRDAYFAALDPRLEHVVDEKMTRRIYPIGDKAGELTPQAAAWTGLLPGTAVAVANVDAHVSVPAATVTEPGRMVAIMGTSICHMVLGNKERLVPGICGYVEDGIIPGYFGFEAGQSAVGDIFAWYVDNGVPAEYQRAAQEKNIDLHKLLEAEAARLKPGESGLLALDWWNGNRSVLVDVELTGMLLGMTLQTKAPEIYRALIEATAYGTRVIIEAFEAEGVTVNEIVTCGGLPEKNPLLMQIYADVSGRELKVTASKQTPALGSAMFGAVAAGSAAGGYDTIFAAARRMARLKETTYKPSPQASSVYNQLYAEYLGLHDYFGRGANDVMKRLKRLKAENSAG
jgi:L-ribulokinase